jgi:cell division control protein 6
MSGVDEIFRRAKEGKALFTDRNALTPDYVPKRLPFRDEQTRAVAEVLAPVLHGSKPSNLLLYGKTGTGKTAVAKYVLSRLEAEADRTRLVVAYVNTRHANSEYRTIVELGQAAGVELPFTGLSVGEALARVFKEMKVKTMRMILVMDEIDYLVNTHGDSILYEFTRSNEQLSPGFLSIVGISNDLKFKEGLDPRVLSSLSEEELVFPPYTVDELREILTERAKVAFKPGVATPGSINLIAAMAGSEHGDARRAIDLLRVAGEVAEREGLSKVDDSCVSKASDKMEHDRVEEAIHSLPIQSKAILRAIWAFKDGTNTGKLYVAYRNNARDMGIDILTQRRMSGILAELDLLGLVQASVVSKGRRGRTKKIQLLVDDDTMRKTLSSEPT